MIEDDLGMVIAQPLSIREQVYKRVSELILTGRFGPSERIAENKLAKQLGVSRTPVREALHVLEMEGFVESIPRTGYKVKEIRWDEVDEICEIRKANETLAARWALERITPQELSSLERNLEAAKTDVERGTPERFIEWDAHFHEILVRASGSQRLVEICQTLRRHMFLYRIKSVYKAEAALLAIEGHQGILSRLREKDAAGVEKAVRDHLDHAKRSIRKHAFEKN